MIFRMEESCVMMKFIYLLFVLFAFIITSCDEQILCDDTYNDNANLLPDSEDDDAQLDTSCSCDDLANNVRVGNKSGSRIIFNEYHLSDGSIISDNTPFDTAYDRHCIYATDSTYEGLSGCCVSFDVDYTDPPYIESFYKDSSCTSRVSLLKLSSKPNNGELVHISAPLDEDEEYTCGTYDYKNIYARIVSPITYNVYVYDYDRCITWADYVEEYEYEKCYYLADYEELTIDEARSLFVCEE